MGLKVPNSENGELWGDRVYKSFSMTRNPKPLLLQTTHVRIFKHFFRLHSDPLTPAVHEPLKFKKNQPPQIRALHRQTQSPLPSQQIRASIGGIWDPQGRAKCRTQVIEVHNGKPRGPLLC